MLVRKFKVRNIKNFEDENGVSILKMFDRMAVSDLVQLIRVGNNDCSEEDACGILDMYLDDEHTIMDAFKEIKYIMFGSQQDEEDDVPEEDLIDTKKYETMTELFQDVCMNMLSVGLSYSEFWEMDTKEIWSVFASIYLKIQNEINRQLQSNHALAGMVAAAVWGKLPKDAPKVDLTPEGLHDDDIIDTEFGEMARGQYNIIQQMKSSREVINKVNNN